MASRLLDGLSHGKVRSVTLVGFPEVWAPKAIPSKRETGGEPCRQHLVSPRS